MCVKVCSPVFQPLDEATVSELRTVLKSFLSQGQVLKLEVKVGLVLGAFLDSYKLGMAFRSLGGG